MDYDLEHLQQLVSRHAPVFHLHPSDQFMPCSVEFFMDHSTLVQLSGVSGQSPKVLLPLGAVSAEALLEQQALRPPPAQLRLELEKSARAGFPVDKINDVPLYAHVKEITTLPDASGYSSVEALEINYLTFYAYNGPYNVGGVRLIQTGAHDGDWEHITARVHPTSGRLLGMWYNAHRSRDGMWVEGSRVRLTQEGRPIAYTALHGHGVYPMPGRIPRHFFMGNDLCSAGGPVWRPHTVVLLPPVHGPDQEVHAGHCSPSSRCTVRLDWALASGCGEEQADPGGKQYSTASSSCYASCTSTPGVTEESETGQSEPGGGGEGAATTADCGLGQEMLDLNAGLLTLDVNQGGHWQQSKDQSPTQPCASFLSSTSIPATSPSNAVEGSNQGHLPACACSSYARNGLSSASVTAGTGAGASLGAGAGRGAGGMAAPLPARRQLHRAHSRGSSLGREGSFGSSGSPCGRTLASSIDVIAETGVRVEVGDPCLWVHFKGQWGQTEAPISQGWFHTAEPPQSRTALLRLFGHFWPETQRI